MTLEQWQAKALYLQEENEKLRRELLDERILAGVIRLESPRPPRHLIRSRPCRC